MKIKHIIPLFIIISIFMFMPNVKADDTITTIELMHTEFTPYNNVSSYEGCVECGIYLGNKYIYNHFDKFYSDNKNKYIFDTLWNDFSIYDTNYVSVLILSNSSEELDLFAIIITAYADYDYRTIMYVDGTYYSMGSSGYGSNPFTYSINGSYFNPWQAMPHFGSANPFIVGTGDFSSSWFYLPTTSFTNAQKYYNQAENTTFYIYDTNSNLINTIAYGSQLPQLYEWGTFDPSSNYTEVNLDNYHYVLLTLKDYTQTEAFSTNLQVKGMIGITPIYNYGTLEKDNITDRCNTNYSDYTNYSLYILQSDLSNGAIYAVKSCEDNSSFKFDNTIFNITYVTDDNVDDPVVVIDGEEYHTIPFNNLTNTANKNEENNYIPGTSEDFSFSNVINNVTETLSSFWSSVTALMGLVTKFFNTLPIEIRAIAITTFMTACTLGLIKIIKS